MLRLRLAIQPLQPVVVLRREKERRPVPELPAEYRS
jgi:hypothetical protein